MVESRGHKVYCGRDGMLAAKLLGTPRITALAQAALAEAASKLTSRQAWPHEISLLLALPEVRPGFTADDARVIQRTLVDQPPAGFPGLRIEHVGRGHAGAIEALERGAARIASSQAELVLVGGVDSYLQADTLEWLDANRRLAREGVRAGFPPGEGAAIVAIASTSACRSLGLSSLAEVTAVACTQEKRDPATGAGLLGEALTQAIVRVAGDRFDQAAYVTDLYCDINGERPRTTDWGFALLRTGGWLRDGTQYETPVPSCGDLGAASAAFNIVLAVRALQREYSHGPRSLVWGASWYGLRGAALIEHAGA